MLGTKFATGPTSTHSNPTPRALLGEDAASSAVWKEDPDYLVVDMSKLPIEDFDDSTYESHTPQEWLGLTRTGRAPLYLAETWQWMPCDIVEYDEARRRFLVKFQVNDQEKWIKRLNLKFDGEDEASFRARMDASTVERDAAVARMRFDHYLDRQPDKGVNRISEERLESIGERVDPSLISATIQTAFDAATAAKEMNMEIEPSLVSSLVGEVEALHKRAVKKGVVLHNLRKDDEALTRFTCLGLRLPASDPAPPSHGMILVELAAAGTRHPLMTVDAYPDAEFDEESVPFDTATHDVHDNLTWMWREGALESVKWLHETFHEHIKDVSFVRTDLRELDLPMEVEQFAAIQKEHCDQVRRDTRHKRRRMYLLVREMCVGGAGAGGAGRRRPVDGKREKDGGE